MTEIATLTRLFILQFRAMETNTAESNRRIIGDTVPDHLADHLISSWEGRGNDFGSFYLNMDFETQGAFLLRFGIPVPGFDEYKSQLEEAPIKAMFLKPPYIVQWLRDMLVFFNNHGIEGDILPGTTLPHVPEDNALGFGNSTNWANYILSLTAEEQGAVFSALETYCRANYQAAF